MALPINHPPELSGKAAERLLDAMEENEKNKGTIDFSEQIERAKKILMKTDGRTIKDGQCAICGEMTSVIAGDSGQWPAQLPLPDGSGKLETYHIECIMKKLYPEQCKEVMDDDSYE